MWAFLRVGYGTAQRHAMPVNSEQAPRLRANVTPMNGGQAAHGGPDRLAKPLHIEHQWAPDRGAMLAALRVALGLPRALPSPEEEADR